MNVAKSNLILAGAAVVLAVPTALTLSSERELFKDVSRIPHLFEGFNEDTIAAVVLAAPKPKAEPPAEQANPQDPAKPDQQSQQSQQVEYDKLVLQRTDNGFVLGQGMGELVGAPINKDMLQAHVWKHLSGIRADPDALHLPDATDQQLAEYGLDKEHAFVVQALNAQNQPVADLLVGRDSNKGGQENVRGVFVRKSDSNDVVLYEDVAAWQRNVQPDLWLDRTVLRAPADKVRRVSLRNPATGPAPMVFVRPEGQGSWEAENPPEDRGAVRQGEVERLVQNLGWLAAQGYHKRTGMVDLAALELDPGKIELSVTWQDEDEQEKTVTVWSGAPVEGKNEVYLRTSDSNFVRTWAAHFEQRFAEGPEKYFDPKGPAPGEDEKPGDAPEGPGEQGDTGEKPGEKPGKSGEEAGTGQRSGDEPAGSEPGATEPPSGTAPKGGGSKGGGSKGGDGGR